MGYGMNSYEKAKELKDSGFKQIIRIAKETFDVGVSLKIHPKTRHGC
jgi:ketol-acid reductoisomerase